MQTAMTLWFGTAADGRGARARRQRRHRRGAGRLLHPLPRLASPHVDLPDLPGPDPGLDLPGRVVLVPAHRGGLRAVQRLGQRGPRGVLRPRRRVHLRPADSTNPHRIRANRAPGEIARRRGPMIGIRKHQGRFGLVFDVDLAENRPMLTWPTSSGTPRLSITEARCRPGSTSRRRQSSRALPAMTPATCCAPRHGGSSRQVEMARVTAGSAERSRADTREGRNLPVTGRGVRQRRPGLGGARSVLNNGQISLLYSTSCRSATCVAIRNELFQQPPREAAPRTAQFRGSGRAELTAGSSSDRRGAR